MYQTISVGVGPHNFEFVVSKSWLHEILAAVPALGDFLRLLHTIITRCRYTYTPLR